MTEPAADTRDGVSRRAVLGWAAAGTTAATAGCVRQTRSVLSRDGPDRISLSIATVPADHDPIPPQIARRLATNLETVGVSTSLQMRSAEEFRREVLVNHSFDLAVGLHPAGRDPDFLYGALHSSFGTESGWQNPYGFTNMDLDEHLESQRSAQENARPSAVGDALGMIARTQPFTPIAFPVEPRVVRTDRFEGFEDWKTGDAVDVLSLSPQDDAEDLRLSIGYTFPTKNLNPLSVEYRETSILTDLLYDSLVVFDGDQTVLWLADSIEWNDTSARITVRDATWHDGEPVTAQDVAFTYRLLTDTTPDDSESPVPAPRYRSRVGLVEDIDVLTDLTLEFTFDCSREVARRAVTVPILPRHVWRERATVVEDGLFEGEENTTEALITDNVPPVGGGPYRFEDRTERDDLILTRYEDHFVERIEELEPYRPPADRFVAVVAPSSGDAVGNTVEGSIDGTLSPVDPDGLDHRDGDSTTVLRRPTASFYHVAYNTRREPLSNPYFRRIVARLLDKGWLVERVFDGWARPAATPIADQRWIPESLQWEDGDPEVPFLGTDGTVAAAPAREALVEAGYVYDSEGYLRSRTE